MFTYDAKGKSGPFDHSRVSIFMTSVFAPHSKF